MAQKHPLSRRSFLAASGATLAATTAVAVPAALARAAEPDPDAELLALADEWKAACVRFAQAADVLAAAETRYFAAKPEFPDACNRQSGDPALNLCASFNVGKPYDRSEIEELRKHGRKRAFYELLTAEERTRLGLPTDALEIQRLEPWPEAQARADEIISAWDKYHADVERAHEESGVEAAEQVENEAMDEMDDIRDRIAQTRAHTLKGLLIKAQMAESQPVSVLGPTKDLESRITHGGSTPDVIGLSLVVDVLSMNGGQA